MRHFRWLIWTYLFACFSAQAASFDCERARTQVEKLICSDLNLSVLDEKIARAYRDIVGNPRSSPSIRQQQREWLRRRNACTDAMCIGDVSVERLLELEFEKSVEIGGAKVTEEACQNPSNVYLSADCIEANQTPYCEAESSVNRSAECDLPYLVVAERRVRRAEQAIIEFSKKSPGVPIGPEEFESAHKAWLMFRKKHCDGRQRAYVNTFDARLRAQSNDALPEDRDLDMGEQEFHCLRDVAEQRADALESFVGVAGMKPDKLDRKGLFEYLRGPQAKR